jgi:CxxC-x17-CxxC domain-containing protein
MIKEFRERGFGGRDRGRSGWFGNRGGGFGGSGRGFGRGRDSRPKEMFDATCSKCGKSCQVPFKPTGTKPVLCSECFGNSDSGNRSGGNSEQLNQINAKLDKIIAILSELELDVSEEEFDEEDSEKADEDSFEEDKEN